MITYLASKQSCDIQIFIDINDQHYRLYITYLLSQITAYYVWFCLFTYSMTVRMKQRSSIYLFTPQMPAAAGAEEGLRQEPGTPFMWWQEAKICAITHCLPVQWVPSPMPSPIALEGMWIGSVRIQEWNQTVSQRMQHFKKLCYTIHTSMILQFTL